MDKFALPKVQRRWDEGRTAMLLQLLGALVVSQQGPEKMIFGNSCEAQVVSKQTALQAVHDGSKVQGGSGGGCGGGGGSGGIGKKSIPGGGLGEGGDGGGGELD
jgi:hypothetical protein